MFIPKVSQNQYVNTFNNDIHKKCRKNLQDPVRDLLNPKVEFARWCSYLELEPLNSCIMKYKRVANKTH